MARNANFVSAVVGGVLASIALATIPQPAAGAPDACLTEPKPATPAGQHWYYRIEHGTGRHCWYLRDVGGNTAQSAAVNTAPSSAEPDRPVPAATSRSIADARDEMPAPPAHRAQSPSTPPAPVASPAGPSAFAPLASGEANNASMPAAAPQPSMVATRWPDPAAASSAIASPAPAVSTPAPAMTETTADAADGSQTATVADAAASTPPAVAPAATNASPAKDMGSLRMLLLVILGALALAGLTASLVLRLARARTRASAQRRKDTIWESADNRRPAPWIEPKLEPAMAPVASRENFEPAYQHDDHYAHEPAYDDRTADRTEIAEDSVEKIEDFLARLTRQLQADLQRAPGAN